MTTAAPGRRSRRQLSLVTAVFVLLAAGVIAWVLLRPGNAGNQDKAADDAQVAAVLDQLATEPASLVAPQAGPDAAAAAWLAVPEGTTVTPPTHRLAARRC